MCYRFILVVIKKKKTSSIKIQWIICDRAILTFRIVLLLRLTNNHGAISLLYILCRQSNGQSNSESKRSRWSHRKYSATIAITNKNIIHSEYNQNVDCSAIANANECYTNHRHQSTGTTILCGQRGGAIKGKPWKAACTTGRNEGTEKCADEHGPGKSKLGIGRYDTVSWWDCVIVSAMLWHFASFSKRPNNEWDLL